MPFCRVLSILEKCFPKIDSAQSQKFLRSFCPGPFVSSLDTDGDEDDWTSE